MEELLSNRRGLAAILVIAIVAFLICQTVRMGMQWSADSELKHARSTVAVAKDNFAKVTHELEVAEVQHLAVYLVGMSVKEPLAAITKAEKLITQATKARQPAKKSQLAKDAERQCDKTKGGFEGWHNELVFLDDALAKYQTEPDQLAQVSKNLRISLALLEGQGYFATHFVASRQAIDLAESNRQKALKLTKIIFKEGRPDYRAIYATCLEGERIIGGGERIANGVVELRAQNNARIGNGPEKISLANSRYNTAIFAATQLERYPRYSLIDSVRQTRGWVLLAGILLDQAKSQNSMQMQQFADAKVRLDNAYSNIENALAVFTEAESKWSRVRTAVTGIPSRRSGARSAIDQARSYMTQWSQNSQHGAESLLLQAETRYRSGQYSETADPIQSLADYQSARELGNQAHSAVDDVDHTPPPQNNSSDDSSTSYGGSGSGGSYSYGGGSGGSSGSGGSDYGGGAYDSGPSSSYDPAPSGHYDAGGL